MDALHRLLCTLLTIYYVILLVRIIVSWVPRLPEPLQPLARFVRMLTDPVLDPVRGLLPPVRLGAMALDLSPLLVFFGLSIIRRALC